MLRKRGRLENVAVGDLFSKVASQKSVWEVVEIVMPSGHQPHARLACVDRPSETCMIAIAALRDKRLFVDAGDQPETDAQRLPLLEEPTVDIDRAADSVQHCKRDIEPVEPVEPVEPAERVEAELAEATEAMADYTEAPVTEEASEQSRKSSSMLDAWKRLQQDEYAA